MYVDLTIGTPELGTASYTVSYFDRVVGGVGGVMMGSVCLGVGVGHHRVLFYPSHLLKEKIARLPICKRFFWNI